MNVTGVATVASGIVSTGDWKIGTATTLSQDNIFTTGIITAASFSGSGAELTGVASTENIRTNTNATFLQNVTVVGTSTVTGNIVPSSDSATDIGTNSVRFQNAYVDAYYGSAANLTNLPAANLTGALPAISAASLTSVPAANIVGLATAGFSRSGGFGGRTISASATLNSTSVDFTGFSADTTRFDVIFRSASTASVDFGVRIGDSGGIETTNYRCRSGYNRSSDNVAEENAGGFFSHGLAGSYTTSGFMTFISLTNAQHRWQCFGRFTENATDAHVFTIDGYRHLDSALTQIRILPESGSFSGGEVHVVTYVD